eukprot:303447_1
MASIDTANIDGIIHKKIRDTAHIQSYLEHFVPPNISLSTIGIAFFTTPFSILLNICFIIYNFIDLNFDSNSTSTTNTNNLKYINIGHQIVVYVEFAGICILFVMIIVSYLLNYKSLFIDCIKNCSSWSSFKLFYYFRPQSLIEYYSICYSHHQTRLKQTNMDKYNKCKQIKQKLQKDIMNINELDDDKQKLNYKMNDTIEQLNIIIDEHKQQQNDKDKETNIEYMIHVASWISFIFISLCLLFVGMISLIMKLVQFKYLSDKDIFEWKYNQYFAFIAFCNQLWNMCNIDYVKKDTIYRFIFMKQNAKYTRFIANKISIYDSIIKQQLLKSFGIKGLFLALSLNYKFLHKLIVQDMYDDYNVNQLLIYKTTLQKQYENKIDDEKYEIINDDNKSQPLLKVSGSKYFDAVSVDNQPKTDLEKKSVLKINFSAAKIKIKQFLNKLLNKLKMTAQQQPIPVFITAQSLLSRYTQKKHEYRHNILYGKTHKFEVENEKISYNTYSLTKQQCDIRLTIKPNFFKNIIVIFEKMEIFIKYFTPICWFLIYCATFITAILALINSNRESELMKQSCNDYNYLYYASHFMISCCIFVICIMVFSILSVIVEKKKIERFGVTIILILSCLGCIIGIIYSIVISCVVLSCVNTSHNENIIQNMRHEWEYYYIFIISISVWLYSLLTIPILFIISYPILFFLFLCVFVIYICGVLAMICSFLVPSLTLLP